jgi:hypothetical protein
MHVQRAIHPHTTWPAGSWGDASEEDDRAPAMKATWGPTSPMSSAPSAGAPWTPLDPQELQILVEQSLNPAAKVWQVKAEQERALKQAQKFARLAHDAESAVGLGWHVGELARLHLFTEALSIMDKMLKLNPESLQR